MVWDNIHPTKFTVGAFFILKIFTVQPFRWKMNRSHFQVADSGAVRALNQGWAQGRTKKKHWISRGTKTPWATKKGAPGWLGFIFRGWSSLPSFVGIIFLKAIIRIPIKQTSISWKVRDPGFFFVAQTDTWNFRCSLPFDLLSWW